MDGQRAKPTNDRGSLEAPPVSAQEVPPPQLPLPSVPPVPSIPPIQPIPPAPPHPTHPTHPTHPAHTGTHFGYPVDPSWNSYTPMHPHHMYPSQGYPHPVPSGIPVLAGSADPLEAVLGLFPCARLRNLPFDATMEDLLVLFQGLILVDAILIVETGEAYVVFANPIDHQMALLRDRHSIRRCFVEILPGSRSDYYTAIMRQQWHERQRGLFLPGENTTGNKKGQLGLQGSSALGSVGTYPVQALHQPLQAMSQPGHQVLNQPPTSGGQRPMEVPMSGRGGSGGDRGIVSGTLQKKRSGGGVQVGDHTGYLRMRGLPFSASADDIAKFFEKYHPVPGSIVLTYRSDGRPVGEAYVAFQSCDDSKAAMELHRQSMGTRYIELFLSNKEEHSRAVTQSQRRSAKSSISSQTK